MDKFDFAKKQYAFATLGNRRDVYRGLQKLLSETPDGELKEFLQILVSLIAAVDGDQADYAYGQALSR